MARSEFAGLLGDLSEMLEIELPDFEAKLVRVTRGSILDVVVDIREGSPTRGDYYAAELSAENRNALFIPKGFAHGFVSLEDDSEIYYQILATQFGDEAEKLIPAGTQEVAL